MGKLLNIAYKTASRELMVEVSHSVISVKSGLENDYRGAKSEKRQITILSREDWEDACNSMGKALPWTTRRVNLFVEGIPLKQSAGSRIQIGDEVILEITGETKPCHRMDEQQKGLTLALTKDWKGGVCCKVVQGGEIGIGDEVSIH